LKCFKGGNNKGCILNTNGIQFEEVFLKVVETRVHFGFQLNPIWIPKKFCVKNFCGGSWPKMTICHPSSAESQPFFHYSPSHLNLSFIVALESVIEPHFSYSLLFEILSVSRVPRTIPSQFLWKMSSKPSSAFRSAHASEPNLTTAITVPSNILILVCRLIFLFFQTFLTVKKQPKPWLFYF